VHGAFVLLAGMSFLPSIHPRMASEQHGPTPTRQLEPPGFLGLNYGRRTPLSVLLAHLAYGGILGGFYRLGRRHREFAVTRALRSRLLSRRANRAPFR
jgi:hypothetical protein